MKFGLLVPLAYPYATRAFVERLGTLAEVHGFDSLWIGTCGFCTGLGSSKLSGIW